MSPVVPPRPDKARQQSVSSGNKKSPIRPSRPVRPGRLSRPPVTPVVLCGTILVVATVVLFLARGEDSGQHLVAAVLGMFGTVLVLGWFRQSLNIKRSGGSFSDWSGPWEATRYMWLLVLAGWIIGASNLYLAVYEYVRPR